MAKFTSETAKVHGSRGGKATQTRGACKTRITSETASAMGRAGGSETARRHGAEHMAAIGARGFVATVERRYSGDASANAYLTDGRHITDISRNDDGSYYLWTDAGELTATAERMVITRSATTTPTPDQATTNRIHDPAAEHIAHIEACAQEEAEDYIAARQAAPRCSTCGSDGSACVDCNPLPAFRKEIVYDRESITPGLTTQSEMTSCPVCKRRYAATGRSIHYCYPSHEYICHYDNQQVGVGYPNHTAAETALDDYCWWLNEAGLVGELVSGEPEPTEQQIARRAELYAIPNEQMTEQDWCELHALDVALGY